MAFASSSCQGLLERISKELLLMTCAWSCKDLLERNWAGFPQESMYARIHNENVRRSILCANLQEKICAPRPGRTVCASLRSRNAHGHVTRAIFDARTLEEKCRIDGVPWSNPGLNTVRSPNSVDPLGKYWRLSPLGPQTSLPGRIPEAQFGEKTWDNQTIHETKGPIAMQNVAITRPTG